MAFINAAKLHVQQLPQGNATRIVLEYLLANAVGCLNACPWVKIDAHLKANGISLTREQFQQSILAETRAGDIFIGSNDHGTSRGYFLIQDEQDARVAREFYVRRIAAQQTNLDRLDDLISQEWP